MSLAWCLQVVAMYIGNRMETLLLLKKVAERLAGEIADIRKRSSVSRHPMSKYQRERYRKLQEIARNINGQIGQLEALGENKEK